jgi:hypothetical protein
MAPAARTAAAAAATMARGWCRIRCHGPVPGGLIGLGNPSGPNGPGPGPQPAEALVMCDRVEPGAQFASIAQIPELGRGDEKRILHRIGGIGPLAQHGTAVRVERHGVPVIGFGEPGGVASHDRGDNLRVLHAAPP